MAGDEGMVKAEAVDAALNGMKLEEELFSSPTGAEEEDGTQSPDHPTPMSTGMKDSPSTNSKTPASQENESAAPTPKSEDGGIEGVGTDITIQVEPGKPPKLSRKASSKMKQRPQPLFDDLPDATEESRGHFTTIKECLYGSKLLGASEHDTLGCDCSAEYRNGANNACGEDSDCINRATKMECTDDECNCGEGCQNQRFQRREYAQVSVIKTEKKGFGLRADRDLQPNDFIFEYIGEVINEGVFRKRTQQYHDEGIRHFYFMSLTKNVFVDATKKGNLGRFCNHSCNPNCYVDKWVVGEKLRMGIFAERPIKAGEELVFNYNVDRYGADPQPCYCGESNCTGFIGGKTQTERATKLSHAVIEALGIEDGDGWDIAVPKKARKKKQGEDDEEYVSNVQPKGLDEHGVTKVMATLMQCKDKWVAVKLLSRVQRCNDDKVRNRVVRMHGYQILRSTLTTWKEDNNVVLQILDILYKLPRLTRNKIVDSKIETAVTLFIDSEHEEIASESKRLLDEWGKLDLAYRIPRKKFDPNAAIEQAQAQSAFERSRRGSESRQETPEKTFVAPSGPRSNVPQRNTSFYRPPISRPRNNLPSGWFAAMDQNGKTYYYSKAGQTTWQRPNEPAADPPPPPIASAKANQNILQSIIDGITKIKPASQTASPVPKESEIRPKEKTKKPKEDWRSWPIERQKKRYENTISKQVIPVMNKFKDKLPRDDCKKFAREVTKTLAASDFKHNKVTDLDEIPDKKIRAIKDYVKEFFKKAVAKKAALEVKRAERKARSSIGDTKDDGSRGGSHKHSNKSHSSKSEELDMEMSDDDGNSGQIISINGTPVNGTPLSPGIATPGEESLKRKRLESEMDDSTPSDTPLKRLKESPTDAPSPPPPPPPPPGVDVSMLSAEEEAMAAQEEELMRESEAALVKENEEAMVLDDDMPSDDHFSNRIPNGGSYHATNGFDAHSRPSSQNGSRPNSRNGSRPNSRNGSRRSSGNGSRPVSRNGTNGTGFEKNPNLVPIVKKREPGERPTSRDESHLDGIHPDRRKRLMELD